MTVEISEALAIRAARWLMDLAQVIPEGQDPKKTQEYKDAKHLYALVREQKNARKANAPKQAICLPDYLRQHKES